MADEHRIMRGDAGECLATLADDSVDLVITSPPYFRHRDYGVERQIGAEATVSEYVAKLRAVLAELLRVTEPTGSCFFVVGDTYWKQKLLLVPHRLALGIAD